MSTATLERPRTRRRVTLPPEARAGLGELGVRLAAFAGLAAYAVGHWTALVADPPLGRVALVVAICLAGGVALQATGLLPRPAGIPARLGIFVAMLALSLMAIGLEARLLAPRAWDELYANVDRGLVGLASVNWPYDGVDEWVRLTVILLGPAVAAVAAALAFWPSRSRRAAALLRTASLCVLLVLFGSAMAEHRFGGDLLRGLLLFGLIGAWLWLPRLRARERAVAAAVIAVMGIASLPLAASLDRDEPLVEYRKWNPFGGERGATFEWNHRYGPLTWTRTGKTLLYAKSSRPYYWKVAALERFDGLFWREPAQAGTNPTAQLPEPRPRRWYRDVDITIRRLKSERIVGAGTMLGVDGLGAYTLHSDGTGVVETGILEEGDSYSFRSYIPQPSREELRAASEDYEDGIREYTHVSLPVEGRTATRQPPLGAESRGADVAMVPPAGLRGPLEGFRDPEVERDEREILASPYAPVYRRTQELVAGSPTIYDAVMRIQRFLHDDPRFRYAERVPTHDYPLVSFLGEDPRGYCQHFSGAMALMLRFAGIPARVASGFAPGSYNRDTKEFRVRDLDAHSWVEVYFAGIGWVPFDPTPPLAPASSQARSGSASTGDASDLGTRVGPAPGDRPQASGSASGDGGGGAAPAWLVLLGFVAIASAVAGALLIRGLLAARRDPEADIHELERALARLGWRMPPGTTLRALEERLRRVHSERAASYAFKLRERRYGPNGARRPSRAERRALRAALTAGGGPLSRLKGLWVLPPRVGGH